MGFTPLEARLNQINAAEDLLHTIDPHKAYPVEFIVFRITGYHPRGLSEEQLAGAALQHDLGMLIESVSETLDVRTGELAEPVLSIEDVTERFNVTSKTIQRWRRRGLPARRFVFPDGKRRVGFLVGSVERFFSTHREQVARGTNFSQVDEIERAEVVRRARRLAGQCGCCAKEIARRIARKMNRSEVTIQHILRKHDEENRGDAIFARAAEALSEIQRQRIARGYRRGMGLGELSRKVCRPRTVIYRAIIEERLERLGRKKVKFIDDPLYHQDDAAGVVREIALTEGLPENGRPEDARVPRDLPPYLAELYRTPLLSPARERALFIEFNYYKYLFATARRRLEPGTARMRDLDELESHWGAAVETKNEILRANLRLVVSIARKHLRAGLSLMELISDGNLTLMRAVDGFDVHRGNKFSTYATLALIKGFARSVPQMLAGVKATSMDDRMMEGLADKGGRWGGGHRERDQMADREQVRMLLAQLSAKERGVLAARFGLDSSHGAGGAGETGVSRHRMGQIEKLAIAKLRRAAAGN